MSTKTLYRHVTLDDQGVPVIDGSNTKVVEVVLSHTSYQWDPDEVQAYHPHLTRGQVYSALAYYWDHKEELDQDIQKRIDRVEEIQKTVKPSRIREKLKAQGSAE